MSPNIVAAGAAAVALLAIFGTMDYYRIALAANERQPDLYRVSYQEPRFRGAVSEIPESAVVGYDSNLETGGFQDDVAFRGVQYAVAPRLLRRVAKGGYGEFVIGNYTTAVELSDMISRASAEFKLELVRVFDSGVVLYRKRSAE